MENEKEIFLDSKQLLSRKDLIRKHFKAMGITKISDSVQGLIDYWKGQEISALSADIKKIEEFESLNGVMLPSDFREFYSLLNGMDGFYPNETDKNGFLFYPIEVVVPAALEFPNSKMENIRTVFLFAEYMHASWWYGFDIIDDYNYNIGIIATRDSFKPICNSLVKFIELYTKDDDILYDYS